MLAYTCRRKILAVALLICVLLCGGSIGVAAKTVINVIGHWSGWQLEAFNEKAREYMDLHPGISIEHIYAPMNQYEGISKLLVLMAGNTTPDIIHSTLEIAPELLAGGIMAPMPQQIANDVQRVFLPQVLSGVTYKGQLYGIPTESQNYALAYNNRILQEAGMASPPTNWDELRAMAGKLTERSADGRVTRYGFAIEGATGFNTFAPCLFGFIWSNGGDYIDSDGKVRLTEQPAVEATSFLADLVQSSFMSLSARMGQGTAAMSVVAPFRRQSFMAASKAEYTNLRSTLVPRGAGPYVSSQYGWGLFVSSQSRHSAEAWKFLHWLTVERSDKGTTRMSDHMVQLGSMPTNRIDVTRAEFMQDPFFEGFIKGLDYIRAEPVLPQISLRQQEVYNIVSPAVLGQMPVQTALEQAKRRIETILAESREAQ